MTEQFLNYLTLERNYSPRTVQAYGDDLREFELYLKELDNHISWQSVDSDIIRGWMEYMMDRGNNATSINRRLSALRSFYRFALKRHLVDADPAHMVSGPKKSKPLPVFLKEKEMEQLLDERMWTSSYSDVLARTLLILFYETGIRLSELTGLDEASVDMVTRELKVTGKRDKQRIIPFGDGLAGTLRTYLKVRESLPAHNSKALLLSAKGERLTSSQVRYIVRKNVARVSTQKKKSPHVLRHTFATVMLNHEAGLESVKKLLGHESLSTTEIYTHTTFEQLKNVYEAAHPRSHELNVGGDIPPQNNNLNH